MMPVRRDLSFELPSDQMGSWHPWGKHVAHFYNTLSIFFPVGERFFIDAVRHYRDQGVIDDERLLEQVRAFIGQEAMHGREHDEYNNAYTEAGFEANRMEDLVDRLLTAIQRTTPPSMQLSATIALEHFTAILAHTLLDNPSVIEGSEEHFEAVWRWHALEETEHKAVAYDVYCAAMENRKLFGYFNRISGMVLTTIIFWALAYPFYLRNVQKAGGLFQLGGWWKAFQFQFGKPWGLRKIVRPYLDYYRPGFHPWDHDNRHFLEEIDQLAERYDAKAQAG